MPVQWGPSKERIGPRELTVRIYLIYSYAMITFDRRTFVDCVSRHVTLEDRGMIPDEILTRAAKDNVIIGVIFNNLK